MVEKKKKRQSKLFSYKKNQKIPSSGSISKDLKSRLFSSSRTEDYKNDSVRKIPTVSKIEPKATDILSEKYQMKKHITKIS